MALKHKSEKKGKSVPAKRHRYKTPLRNPAPTSVAVSRSMQGNRAKDTTPERILRKKLRDCGLVGYRLHSKDVPGRPDIAFTRQRVAIFVHGCFWHRCPHCKLKLPKNNRAFWIKKFRRNRARDQRKARQLRSCGWLVLQTWECKIASQADSVVARIERTLTQSVRPNGDRRARLDRKIL